MVGIRTTNQGGILIKRQKSKSDMEKLTVYSVRHVLDDRVLYIGVTNNLKRRQYEHKYSEKWADVGFENVYFKVEANASSREEALHIEDELIVQYNTISNGYNECRSGLCTKNDEYLEWQRKKNYNENIGSILKYQREYRASHKQMLIDRDKLYYENHKEYVKQRQREYHKRKKEEMIKNGTYDEFVKKAAERSRKCYLKKKGVIYGI